MSEALLKIVGPTFVSECIAAGVWGLPFSVCDGAVSFGDISDSDRARVQAVISANDPAQSAPAAAPDGPTLSDWRVALTLWGRMDDVTAKVESLAASTNPNEAKIGSVAKERLEYSNNVFRAQLMQLKDAFGFTVSDVDESLWRASLVARGDLSGVWPVAS